MSLQEWLNEGRVQRHRSSAQEVGDLFRLVERDLADAALTRVSPDRRFATAYNAALQLATVALRVSGYRATGTGHHSVTFQALPEVMGAEVQDRADYLEICRRKRNVADYGRVGEVSESEVEQLIEETQAFRSDLVRWLKTNYPHLVAAEP